MLPYGWPNAGSTITVEVTFFEEVRLVVMMGKESTSAPLRMFFLVVSISFIIELGEGLLPLGYVEQTLGRGVVDGALLSLTLVPILYFLTYRPWQKELARRLSAERDRNRVIELTPAIIASVGLSGIVVDMNGAVRMLGWAPGEVIGRHVINFVHPDDRVVVTAGMQGVSGESTTTCFRCRVLCRDGGYKWLEWLGELDTIEGVIRGVGRDITQQKEAEDALKEAHRGLEWRVQRRTEELLHANQALADEMRERVQVGQAMKESEERYRRLVECSPDAIAVHSEGKCVFVNPAAMKLLGATSPEQLVGRPITDIVDQDYQKVVAQQIEVMSTYGTLAPLIEVKFVRLDGTSVDVEVCSAPFPYRGKPCFIGIARDIGDRKKILVALTESEERYRTLAETAPDTVFVVNREGYVEYINKRGAELMGLPQEQVTGRLHRSLFPADQADRHWMNLRKVLESGVPLQSEGWTQVGSGALWQHTTLVPIRGASGEVRAVLGVARDLTEHKRAEQALAESEAWFRAIFERTTVGIVVMDSHGRIVEANSPMQRILGYSREELLGTDFRAVTHPDDVVVQGRLHEELMGGKRERYQLDKRYMRKDGTIRWAHVIVSTVDYGHGYFILGIAEDVTERKAALEDLAQVQVEWNRMFETIHSIMVMDTEHRIIAVNHATTDIVDLSEAEFVGKKCYELFHSRSEPIEGCPMERALRSKKAESEEVTLECVSGRFRVWCNPILGETGEVERVIHVATDVTERLRAEETLRDYETRMRAVFESLSLLGRKDLEGGRVDRDRLADDLTERELAVLRLVAEGRTNKEIGDVLALAEVTIKKHVQTILEKLGTSDRTQAAILAMRLGLIR